MESLSTDPFLAQFVVVSLSHKIVVDGEAVCALLPFNFFLPPPNRHHHHFPEPLLSQSAHPFHSYVSRQPHRRPLE